MLRKSFGNWIPLLISITDVTILDSIRATQINHNFTLKE